MNGLHLTADCADCRCPIELLCDSVALAAACLSATEAAGLQMVGERWHRFPDTAAGSGGVTGVLLLAESHIAIHSWPERMAVTLDVYVCNFGADNSGKARALMASLLALLQPGRLNQQQFQRGLL